MMKTVKKYEPKPRQVEEVKAYKCPCGKSYINKQSAIDCCDAHKCDHCDNKPAYTYSNLCRKHYEQDKLERQSTTWQKSEKKPWNDIDYVYSDYLNKYLTEEDIEYEWEEDFPGQPFNFTEAAEHYCLYLCEQAKPSRINLESMWQDALICDDFSYEPEMPEGLEELQSQIDAFMTEMNWPLIRETNIGLRV